MTCPRARAPPSLGSVAVALSPWLCCVGASPWCSTIPSPTPGLQGVISEAPAHSSRQTSGVCPGSWATGQPPPDATHACKTRGGPPMGQPPCRQPNSPHLIQAGVPLAQGQIASPAPPSKMSTLLCSPLLLAKGPTCPPSSETCLGWQFSPALSLPPTPSSMSSSSDYGGYRV